MEMEVKITEGKMYGNQQERHSTSIEHHKEDKQLETLATSVSAHYKIV